MAAFKRPGELSASAFGLSFADRDVGGAAQAPIYNKNERLALTEQVGSFRLCCLDPGCFGPCLPAAPLLCHSSLATCWLHSRLPIKRSPRRAASLQP